MVTGIGQRLDIIGSPWPGVVYQRDAHARTSPLSPSLTSAQPRRNRHRTRVRTVQLSLAISSRPGRNGHS